MSDFSRPEYNSYVQLCRELRLERRLRPADFYWAFGDTLLKDRLEVYAPVRASSPVLLPRGEKAHGTIWLPTLADWLEMLEEKGYEAVTLERINHVWFARSFNDKGHGGAVGGLTREEAAARLWTPGEAR